MNPHVIKVIAMERTSKTRKLIGPMALIGVIGVMVAFSVAVIVNPMLYYTPERSAQVSMLNTPGSRKIFTTYFYWYQSRGADYPNSIHCAEWWNTTLSYPPNVPSDPSKYPQGWPGPTNPAAMMQNITATGGWHDYNSYHPPAQLPVYDSSGAVLPSSLKNGTMEHLGSWFDWKNESWHEWELRCMMRAGIDVLMPVYWWNGKMYGWWSIEGLRTLVQSWYHLAPKLVAEHQATSIADAYSKMPKICMFYDTTSMRQLWADITGQPFNGSGADLNDAAWQERFWSSIDDFLSNVTMVDENCSFSYNDRFVVWLYSSSWFADVGTSVFDYCREQCLQKYGHSINFVGGEGWKKAGVDGVCDWGACCNPHAPQETGIPVGGVGPGYYNIGAIAGQTPLYTARDPSKYISEWHGIMDAGAMWVHVETWNELHEGTGIAWSQEYGFTWIDLTRQMTDIFHSMTGYNPYARLNIITTIATLGAMIVILGVAGIATRTRRI